MSASIISEIRKILSTRMWWVLLLVMALFVAAFAGFLGFAMATGMENAEPDEFDLEGMVTAVYTMGVSFGYVFPLVIGALSVTSEFRHRTIDATLLAEPNRLKVIVAKFIAVLPFGLLYGVVSVASGTAIGAGAFAIVGEPAMLDSTTVWKSLGLGVVALAAWALVGVGFGTALPNQVIVLVAVLGWTQFVEPMLRMGLSFVDALQGITKFFPGAAGDALVGSSIYSAAGDTELLPPWAGLLMLLSYATIAAIVGWLITLRRDIS